MGEPFSTADLQLAACWPFGWATTVSQHQLADGHMDILYSYQFFERRQ